MKNIVKIAIVSSVLILLSISVNRLLAQEPPHPPASGHGNTGNQPPPGGAAPVSDGLKVLFICSLLYVTYKTQRSKEGQLQ